MAGKFGGIAALAALGVVGFLAGRRRTASPPPRRRVVVLGAGFGGLAAAQRLRNRPGIELTLVDTHNHHLFQPLLYQVATAALSPADIASSVRGTVRPDRDVHVHRATVTGIDPVAREVQLGDGATLPYDELVIATGSRPSYFGHGEWARCAPGLKTLEDALDLRQRILETLERASDAPDEAERRRLLTFVLIGGGPTGVEMAGSIAELAHDTLRRDFDLEPSLARIVLIEAGPDILTGFTGQSRAYAKGALRQLGVEVRTGLKVTAIEPDVVHTEHEVFRNGCTVWTAGTEATPAAGWLGVTPGKGGRVEVDPHLLVPGRGNVAVIGDAASCPGPDGKPLPGLAPVAKQQGGYAAWSILGRQAGRRRRRFRYLDLGTLATIGRNRAVAEFGAVRLRGTPAWLTWAVAHIFFLIGFRNRVVVSAQWAFAYATHERGSRLIIGAAGTEDQARRHALAKPE